MRHARETRDAAMTCIECAFSSRKCEGATVSDLERKTAGLFSKFVVGNDFVDQAERQRLVGSHLRISKPNLFRLLLADYVLKVPSTIASVEGAHHRANLSKDRALLCDGAITQHLQHVAPADGEAIYRSDDGLLALFDRLVHF